MTYSPCACECSDAPQEDAAILAGQAHPWRKIEHGCMVLLWPGRWEVRDWGEGLGAPRPARDGMHSRTELVVRIAGVVQFCGRLYGEGGGGGGGGEGRDLVMICRCWCEIRALDPSPSPDVPSRPSYGILRRLLSPLHSPHFPTHSLSGSWPCLGKRTTKTPPSPDFYVWVAGPRPATSVIESARDSTSTPL